MIYSSSTWRSSITLRDGTEADKDGHSIFPSTLLVSISFCPQPFFFLLSIKIYRKSPPSLMALPHSTLRNMKSMKNSCKSLSHLSMHYQLSIPHLSSILTISLHVWHIFWTSKQWSKIFSTF